MELTNTNVRYLLTIYHLSQARLEVSSKDIAQTLDVSRASVTSMIHSDRQAPGDQGAVRQGTPDRRRLPVGPGAGQPDGQTGRDAAKPDGAVL